MKVIVQSPDGYLWCATQEGLVRFDGVQFTVYDKWNTPAIKSNNVRALCFDRSGALWIGTNGGLLRMKDGSFTAYTTREGLIYDNVTTICATRDGSIWAGTYGGGLSRLKDGRFTNYTSKDGLAHNSVLTLLEDRAGTLWIGTNGGGLCRFSEGRFSGLDGALRLPNPVVYALCQTRDGALWAGTYGGGINRMLGGRFTAITTKEGLPNDLIRSICEDSGGSLWVGTDGGGAARIAGGRIRVFNAANGLSSNRVIAVKSDRKGTLWAGTNGGGLNRIRDGAVKVFQDGSISASMVNLIFEDSAGRLWIGSYGGGLSILEGERLAAFPGQDAIGKAIVSHIMEDPDGTLWLGTIGSGLLRLRNGALKRFTKRDGLFDDVAYEVLDDGLGYLWMSGNKGVFRVARRELEAFSEGASKSLKCDSFGEADGMKSAECNGGFVPAGSRTRDGRLWFPTMRGVSVVDPSRLVTNELAPPVLVERVVVNGADLDLSRPAILPPGRNRVEIHYTGLSFVAPSKVKFRYILEGYESAWVEADTRRVAYYTNIPPGQYSFRVIACNNDGAWNEAGASLPLLQRPRFYQTWWAYLFCAILLLIAGTGINMARVRQLSARQRQLEALVGERTRELQGANLMLEKANARLETLSAEDPLTGLANRRRFDEHLARQWRQLGRALKPLSIVMVDLDSFKPYNDTLGHLEGDECLARVARVLAASASRAGDLSARYGGEEFALVLSDTDSEGALALAETMRSAVQALGIPHPCSLAGSVVTVSAGVATAIPGESSGPRDLVELADKALYRAKQTGRNRVCTPQCRDGCR